MAQNTKNQNSNNTAVVPFAQQHPVSAKSMEPLTMPIPAIFKMAEENNLPASVSMKLGEMEADASFTPNRGDGKKEYKFRVAKP